MRPFSGRLLAIALVAVPVTASAQPKSVLFYGNSFTFGAGSSRSVNSLFDEIAVAAGHEDPRVQSAAVSGQTLNWHLNNNTNPILTTIPPSDDWDAIVLQEHSTKLTRVYTGSPGYPQSVEQSKADAIGLYNLAKDRSPDVTPVLYETWARGPGHEFYTGADPDYPDPHAMQAEIRDGYDSLKQAIDDSTGAPTAVIAPVGDAWAELDYDRLHDGDLWHAQNRGTLLAALVIYGTVYEDTTTSDIDLTGVLSSLSLTAQDGVELTAAADAVLNPIPEPGAALLALSCLLFATPRRNG